jgi:hypothetical protein
MVYRGGCVAEYSERSPSTYDEQIGVAWPREQGSSDRMTVFVGLDVSVKETAVRRRRYQQSRVRTKGADRT